VARGEDDVIAEDLLAAFEAEIQPEKINNTV